MSGPAPRFGVLASTGGAVLSSLLRSPWFRARLALVAADRECGALAHARAAGIATALCASPDAPAREAQLAAAFAREGVGHVLVFYTRLLAHALLERFRGRLWNLHPALLPAFPGRHGIADALRSGARVLGTTLHVIDAGCDTGPIALQTAFARDPAAGEVATRHAVYCQQVRSALQLARWLADDRVRSTEDAVTVSRAPAAIVLDGALYAPGLDDDEAIRFAIAAPAAGAALRSTP